jgi:hypothetical protein
VLAGFINVAPYLFYGFYDRYLLMLVPLLAAAMISVSGRFPELAVMEATRTPRAIAFALLALWGVISIAGTRDYLTWNGLRWQALNELMQTRNVGPELIDGGAEFNGYYLYDPAYKATPNKSGWWVQDDVFQIGFGVVPGYTAIEQYDYWHWFPPHHQKIVVMQRNAVNESAAANAIAR